MACSAHVLTCTVHTSAVHSATHAPHNTLAHWLLSESTLHLLPLENGPHTGLLAHHASRHSEFLCCSHSATQLPQWPELLLLPPSLPPSLSLVPISQEVGTAHSACAPRPPPGLAKRRAREAAHTLTCFLLPVRRRTLAGLVAHTVHWRAGERERCNKILYACNTCTAAGQLVLPPLTLRYRTPLLDTCPHVQQLCACAKRL